MMGSRTWIPVLVIAAVVSLGASCSGSGRDSSGRDNANSSNDDNHSSPEQAGRVESLEQVDLSDLTRAERRIWIELVNDQLSPCGEPVSVGRCVAEERGCRRCVPASRYLSRLIAEGYERSEVEELYRLRYGRDTEIEVSIEGSPIRGTVMAPLTIVEFSDFECPFCGRAHSVLQQVLEEYEGRIRLVFKNYPLSSHQHAQTAARAAVAASNQDKFWQMHDMLFEHQRALEEEDIESYAEEIGLDIERFRRDMQSEATQQRIDADRELGRQVGVDATPTFFINGRRFRGAPTTLSAYIREELDD